MWQAKPFRLFILVCGLLFFAHLLVMNDDASVWSGAEARLLKDSMSENHAYFLPVMIQSLLTGDLSFNLFISRLPSVLLILSSVFSFFFIGKRIFGAATSALTLVVWATTLLIPSLGKLASADSWLFCSQLIAWAAMIRFLKQPQEKWRIVTFAALLLSLWINPVSTIIFFSLGAWWLYRFHADGNRILLINPWIVLLAGGFALFILGQWQWRNPTFFVGWFATPLYIYFFLVLIGFLPVFGFLLGGLREVYQKFYKKEELAIITSGWLLAGLLSQSLLLVAGLGFLVAKQLTRYFDSHYPHRSLVRAGAIIHLVLAFCGLTVLLLSSFWTFGPAGFRAVLAMGAPYWTLSFIGVIGLYSFRRRFIWGGALFSGLLFALSFWLQVYPLLESKRNWPLRLEEAAQRLELNTQSRLYIHQLPSSEQDKVKLYCEPFFRKIVFTDTPDQLREFYQNDRGNAFFLPRSEIRQLENISDSTSLSGWTDGLKELDYALIRN